MCQKKSWTRSNPKALVPVVAGVGHEEILPPCGHFPQQKLESYRLCCSEIEKVFSLWPFDSSSTLAVPGLQSALRTKFPSFQKINLLTVLKQCKKEQEYRTLIPL